MLKFAATLPPVVSSVTTDMIRATFHMKIPEIQRMIKGVDPKILVPLLNDAISLSNLSNKDQRLLVVEEYLKAGVPVAEPDESRKSYLQVPFEHALKSNNPDLVLLMMKYHPGFFLDGEFKKLKTFDYIIQHATPEMIRVVQSNLQELEEIRLAEENWERFDSLNRPVVPLTFRAQEGIEGQREGREEHLGAMSQSIKKCTQV